jgi:thiol:disulfide interchange protein DsbA
MLIRRLLLVVLLLGSVPSYAQLLWQEGVNYKKLPNPQTAGGVPAGKIEVAEVFSYGCIYCYRAKGEMAKLAAALPADAAMTYVHASFAPGEAWPMFQRAYYAARRLGIADALHDGVFTAVWESGEIPLLDIATGRIRKPLPTIEDAAKFYARLSSVKAADFLKTAASPAVEADMRRADELTKLWMVPGTPALVVNGRYIVDNSQPHAQQRQVALFLVSMERTRLKTK